MRDWSEFDRWNKVDEIYLPMTGEGDTMATQIVTAVTRLVFKWFNDGDVFDNSSWLDGWCNNLSSYANWLARYTGAKKILDRVYTCYIGDDYTDLLYDLCEALLDMKDLERWNKQPKQGSIYDCDGDYHFEELTDKEEEWY